MKLFDFSQLVGWPLSVETMEWIQDAALQVQQLGALGGSTYILSGCIDNGTTISAGWVVINREVLPFAGGVKQTYIVVQDTTSQRQFKGGANYNYYHERTAIFGTGPGQIAWASLNRIGAGLLPRLQAVEAIAQIFQLEDAVIVSGCGITVAGSNVTIATGYAVFNSTFVVVPSYTGGFPIYLKPDGSWVNTTPGTGTYITFDPYTSQNYKDVLRRAQTEIGKIEMSAVLSNRFDDTGLGKWEMKGFAQMNGANGTQTMAGFVPIGFGVNADANVNDAAYATAGNTIGEKMHQLTKGELPDYDMPIKFENNGTDGSTNNGKLLYDGESEHHGSGEQSGVLNLGGGNQKHENRQPSRVVVFYQRIAI